jgi:hypothetical protein
MTCSFFFLPGLGQEATAGLAAERGGRIIAEADTLSERFRGIPFFVGVSNDGVS